LLTGKIPYFTTPPAREVSEHAESSIVATWGKEFDVEDVFKNEESTVIAGLPCLVDTLHVEMPSTAPLTMDIDIPEGDSVNEEEEEEEEEEAGEDAGLTEMDTAETAVVTRGRAYLNQNDRLYDEEGIQNPHAKRAEKKRRKKAGKQGPAADAKEANDDYDFNIDYQDGQVLLPEQEEDDTDEDEEDEGDAMDGVN
jgi:nuclear GTP-binding protein